LAGLRWAFPNEDGSAKSNPALAQIAAVHGAHGLAAKFWEYLFEHTRDMGPALAALTAWRANLAMDRHGLMLERLLRTLSHAPESRERERLESEVLLALPFAPAPRRIVLEQESERLGIGVPDLPPTGLGAESTLVRTFLNDITEQLRGGSWVLARKLALHAALDVGVGAAPGRLVVDALINGGSPLEAHQLARTLAADYPRDGSALTALLVTAGWRARRDEANMAAEAALANPPSLPEALPDLLRQVAQVDPTGAAEACARAIGDPHYERLRDQLDTLATELRQRNTPE
jgi:hypothetical protein